MWYSPDFCFFILPPHSLGASGSPDAFPHSVKDATNREHGGAKEAGSARQPLGNSQEKASGFPHNIWPNCLIMLGISYQAHSTVGGGEDERARSSKALGKRAPFIPAPSQS